MPVEPSAELDLEAIAGSDDELGSGGLAYKGDEASEDLMPPWPDLSPFDAAIASGSVAEELTRAFGDRDGRDDRPAGDAVAIARPDRRFSGRNREIPVIYDRNAASGLGDCAAACVGL